MILKYFAPFEIGGGDPDNPTPPKLINNYGFALHKPNDLIKIVDNRTVSPTTGLPLNDKQKKTITTNSDLIKDIVIHAKAKGIDPLTALAISYQETGLNKDAPFNLNPKVFGKPFGNAEEGMQSLTDQFKYAKDLQKRGVIPNDEAFLLQGNNGYGTIKKGHADLEGAQKIYGLPIPDEGINFAKNPLYGKTIISLRDLLKSHPDIMKLINETPAPK